MFAHINQTNIFFDVDGQHVEVKDGKIIKKPVILVVHGGPGGTHLNFKPHLDSLTACAQLIYIDQRGCGFSDESDTDLYTLEQNVEDIEALRKHLGLEKIWVLGHSYGGMVAMSYALKYQNYLNGLLLMATSPSHRFLEKAKKYVEEHGNKAQKYYAEKLWEGSFQSEEEVEEYYKVMQPLYSIKSSNNDQKKPYVKRAYRVLNKGFSTFLRTFDLTEDLKNIDVPTLIVAGKHDWITPVSESEEIHQQIPHSTLHILENSGHSVFVDENKNCISLIKNFITTYTYDLA